MEKQDIEQAMKNNDIVTKRIDKELETLSLLTKDYSRWSETYYYIHNKDKSYIEDNYLGVDLKNFSLVSIYNIKGERVNSFRILEDGTVEEWPFLAEKISKESPWFLSTYENIKRGFLNVNKEILILASSPVFLTNTAENSNGVLIFGKPFNEAIQNEIGKETGIKYSLINLNKDKFKTNYPYIYKYLLKESKIFVDTNQRDKIITYSIIYDFFNRPIFILSTETQKKFELFGRKIQNYTFSLTVFLTLLILIIIYCSIKNIIINPLKLLQRIFQNISPKNEIPEVYYSKLIAKKDEISELTEEFKNMNDKIFDLHHNLENKVKERTIELRRANESLKLVEKIIENTAEGIIVTDLEGKIVKVNRGFLTMTEFSENEVLGENPRILKS